MTSSIEVEPLVFTVPEISWSADWLGAVLLSAGWLAGVWLLLFPLLLQAAKDSAKTDAINNAMSFFIFDSLHFMIIFSNIRMPRSLGDDLSVQKKCKVRIVYFVKFV